MSTTNKRANPSSDDEADITTRPVMGSARAQSSALMTTSKRHKPDNEADAPSMALTTRTATTGAVMRTLQRTSSLQAPIMHLTGHTGQVLSVKFSPTGDHIASGSFDHHIYLWNTYGECKNYNLIKGHSAAVLEVQWSRDSSHIFSVSADKTVGIWDAETGARTRRFKGHSAIVNSCSLSRRGTELLASASDDGTVKLWDAREKHCVDTLLWNNGVEMDTEDVDMVRNRPKYPETAVCWSQDGSLLFSGGVDNKIKAWDLRKKQVVYTLKGHADTLTGLRISPDGTQLMSTAMDNTVKIWDVKPFAVAGTRLLKTLEGAPHGFEKNLIRPCWSPDSDFVVCGSGDRSVVVWDVITRRIVYKLPGHKGCVNEVDWHPKEPILVSGSNDRSLFLGEVNPDEVR